MAEFSRLNLQPEGVRLTDEARTNLRAFIGGLLVGNQAMLETLGPGEHDLWITSKARHMLIVGEDGEASYALIPHDSGVVTAELTREGAQVGSRHGVRVEPVPATHPLKLLAGGHPTLPGVRLFSVVLRTEDQPAAEMPPAELEAVLDVALGPQQVS